MLMQAAILVLVVTPFSFDLHLAHVLVGMVVLAGFSVGVGALSFALALASSLGWDSPIDAPGRSRATASQGTPDG